MVGSRSAASSLRVAAERVIVRNAIFHFEYVAPCPEILAFMSKKRKVRTDFRKNREVRARDKHAIDRLADADSPGNDAPDDERVSGKGHISRKRTVAGAEIVKDDAGTMVLPDVDRTVCRLGRVLRVQGLISIVRDEQGGTFQCATRRLLKTLATDQRHVVAAGDVVWFRPEGADEGIIERVEPRRGVVSRTSRGRQHVLVANVDQLIIVTSAAEPRIKPNLIDRLLVTAERAGIRPVICINKIDLVEPADLLPLVGCLRPAWATKYCLCRRRLALASIGCGRGWRAKRAS